jgi:hypothetical protein
MNRSLERSCRGPKYRDLTLKQVKQRSLCAVCQKRVTFVGPDKDGDHRMVLEPISVKQGKIVVYRGYPPMHDRCVAIAGLARGTA